MRNFKSAFTLIEVLIVISIIGIMALITIPPMVEAFDNSKQNIIDIYNGKEILVIDVETNEVIYQGKKEDFHLEEYTLVDIEYGDYITMKVKKGLD